MKTIFLIYIFTLASCASSPSRPSLYPNELYQKNGLEKGKEDIDDCISKAEDYMKTPEGEKLVKSNNSSSSTSVGLGFGTGELGLGFGVGQSQSRLSSHEIVRRNFTSQCLANKGYQVVGWDK